MMKRSDCGSRASTVAPARYGAAMPDEPWILTPVAWELVYGVQPDRPIGRVRLHHDLYRAWCGDEDLGMFATGDDAAVAIWRRFCDQSAVRHEEAAITHGAYERHVSTVIA